MNDCRYRGVTEMLFDAINRERRAPTLAEITTPPQARVRGSDPVPHIEGLLTRYREIEEVLHHLQKIMPGETQFHLDDMRLQTIDAMSNCRGWLKQFAELTPDDPSGCGAGAWAAQKKAEMGS